MFRRMYLTIVGLLIASTGILLSFLGVAVYRELQHELEQEGRLELLAKRQEVHSVVAAALQEGVKSKRVFHDERGQTVYFYAQLPDMKLASWHFPIAASTLTHVPQDQFAEIESAGHPFRVYHFVTTVRTVQVQAYVCTLITQEKSMLYHASRLMWTVGSIGFVIALIGNLFLAQRLMRPTYRTWRAYQDTVFELSHELQTPLATVNAMMSSRKVDAQTQADVRYEIERASRMVSDMLFLSKLRSGFSERPSEPVAVSDITEEVAERYTDLGSTRNIYFVGHALPGLFVTTVSGEWERLISTLFKNVIDHAASNSTAQWQLASDGRRVRFTIENEVAFSNVEAVKHHSPERGVGLQIVRRLTARMRGKFETVTEGSKFKVVVTIPFRRPRW
ncbi:sensor histidine kinase [Alicyclobacillus fodiniaquatilis]|uniref:histidine kinase n=1 Tax=Alicyclobacillus fodiniaquatilis TaxID=1661150 RepID=A0ABW4JJS2_9BACL